MRQHKDKTKPQCHLPLLGAHRRLLGWIYRKNLNCCFSPPAWGGVIKKAVNQELQAHLIACRDLVTQILLEHGLMAGSHTHRCIHTHRACFAAGIPIVLASFAFGWCLSNISPWSSVAGWEKYLSLCGREQEAWMDADTQSQGSTEGPYPRRKVTGRSLHPW